MPKTTPDGRCAECFESPHGDLTCIGNLRKQRDEALKRAERTEEEQVALEYWRTRQAMLPTPYDKLKEENAALRAELAQEKARAGRAEEMLSHDSGKLGLQMQIDALRAELARKDAALQQIERRIDRPWYANDTLLLELMQTIRAALAPAAPGASEPKSTDYAVRVQRFRDTTGALRGGNRHPDRCVCQTKETGTFADTPHVHYPEPPFACARCKCEAYEPAVPSASEPKTSEIAVTPPADGSSRPGGGSEEPGTYSAERVAREFWRRWYQDGADILVDMTDEEDIDMLAALIQARELAAGTAAWNEAVDACANHIGCHSCVSSCCDAQPGGSTAAELAMCVRQLARPAAPKGEL